MKKRIFLPLLALTLAVLCACGGYKPAGEPTGLADLDAQVLTVLEEVCAGDKSLAENAAQVYAWVAKELQYRAGTADTSGGFTEELTRELALEMVTKRRGNCDGEAALMAVLLQRMGCETVIVEGQFARDDSGQLVDHTWVIAQVDGAWTHFDPLYGRYYAGDQINDYCMANDARMELTHQWDRDAYPACD